MPARRRPSPRLHFDVDHFSSPSWGSSAIRRLEAACVSQRDGEETRIDMDLPSAVFSKFPETRESEVPALLDAEMVKVFEDAAA
jgi:hypothetical protein